MIKTSSFSYLISSLINAQFSFVGAVLLFLIPNLTPAQEFDTSQEEFANKEWFLTKLVIDGEDHPFIPNHVINQSVLYTDELEVQNNMVKSGITIEYCEVCGTEIKFENDYQFKRGSFTCLAMDYCSYASPPLYDELEDYHQLYFHDFWKHFENSGNLLFDFQIAEAENYLTMVITNVDGNQAYYSDVPLSISSYLEKNEITLYPNPITDFLYIENLTEPVQIEIYDLSGKVLLSQEVNEATNQVNSSQLSEGIYLYQLGKDGQKVKMGKLVKN